MSEVTARKWRPRLFAEFIGQEYLVYSLQQSMKESKIAQGYLFSGPRGIGKTSIARVLATVLNCLNFNPQLLEPCLQCKNCIEIREGRSPDVIEIDGASNRGIDDMREMRSNIQFLPTYSKYKIYIIDEVHMLTTEAFNSILKVLEEPPSYLVFMFATTELHKVKNTVRSRCQQFFLKRLTQEQIIQQLEKILQSYHVTYSMDALGLIAKMADGSMRDSQSILDQVIILSGGDITLEKAQRVLGVTSLKEILDLFHIIAREDLSAVKNFIHDFYIRGEELEFFILQVIEALRHILFCYYHVENSELDQELYQDIQSLSKIFSQHQVQTFIDLFMQLFKDAKDTDHEYFLLEGLLYKCLQYKKFVNLENIVERLADLESMLNEPNSTLTIDSVEQKIVPLKKGVTSADLPGFRTEMDIFVRWKEQRKSPRDQNIFLDIKSVQKDMDLLKIEFLTKHGLSSFQEYSDLQESLIQFFKQHGVNIHLAPFVEEVNLEHPHKTSATRDDITQTIISSLAQELGGEIIHEKE